MLVFLIALIPALAVIVTRMVTNSKAWTTSAALIAAAIGVFTGNPIYALLDIFVVAAAYWLAIDSLRGEDKYELKNEAEKIIVANVRDKLPGEGVIAGAEVGWDEQMVIEQHKIALAEIKKEKARAYLLALRAQIAADALPAAEPVQRKGKLAPAPVDSS